MIAVKARNQALEQSVESCREHPMILGVKRANLGSRRGADPGILPGEERKVVRCSSSSVTT